MRIILGIAFIGLAISSCDDSQTKDLFIQKMIEEDVQQRVKNFILVREEVCQKQVLERAISLADSIMLEEVRQLKINTTVPNVPDKPQRPEVKVNKAYERVRPLLDSLKNNKRTEKNNKRTENLQSLKNS